jgi:peptidoglycan hydrolase-like protein with peptidoglycan-binding domain
MQTLLISHGYNCGRYGADGEFGAATAAALRKFQTEKRLLSDAECGEKTWAKLLT